MILSSGRQAEALLDVFRGHAERVVAISSMDVYRACGVLHGTEPGPLEPLPLTESSPVRTQAPDVPARTGRDAPAGLRVARRRVRQDPRRAGRSSAMRELPGTVLRLPMVYGPGDPLRRFYPVVKRVLDGRRVMLVSDASLAHWRATKGYVEDVARAIALAATAPRDSRTHLQRR